MDLMVFVLVFLTGLLALEGTTALLRTRADPARVRKRLRGLAEKVAEADVGSDSIRRTGGSIRLPSLRSLELLLYRGGGTFTPNHFLLLSVFLASSGFATLFLMTNDPIRSIPALLTGLVPWLFARRAAAKRMQLFSEQLPDALELMSRCMRTGHALGAGFQMVGEELPDPAGTEFGLVSEEIRMGLELREALEKMMARVGNEDLPYFTTAVLIQRQTGGNLAELLDKLSTLVRERMQFDGRVHALTAQGRGAATFLALWMPTIVVAIWIVAPGYLAPLVENTWGHMILGGAFAIDGLAYFLSLRIADVQA